MDGRAERASLVPLAVREAIQELRGVRDSYQALEALLDGPASASALIDRRQLAALLNLINLRFAADLARAEAACTG